MEPVCLGYGQLGEHRRREGTPLFVLGAQSCEPGKESGLRPRFPAVGVNSKACAPAPCILLSLAPMYPLPCRDLQRWGGFARRPGGFQAAVQAAGRGGAREGGAEKIRLEKPGRSSRGWGEKSKAKVEQSSYHKPRHLPLLLTCQMLN